MLWGARCVGEEDDVCVAPNGQTGFVGGVVDVNGVAAGGSGGGLCGLEYRDSIYSYPIGDDGLRLWFAAEEACVGAGLCDVCIYQVEKVPRLGLVLLACDGRPSFVVLLVSSECWPHGLFVAARAVWVAAVVFDSYTLWVSYTFAGERLFCRGCLGLGYMCWVA